MANFRIRLPADGYGGEVFIDDKDIARQVVSLQLGAMPGERPHLSLDVRGDVDIEGEGIVEIGRVGPGEDVLEWLAGIDPAWLEEAVLREADLAVPPAAAFLNVLARKAAEERG